MSYIEQATSRAGGLIKGTLATAEMRRPGGQDPLEVTDIHAVPDLFKKCSITIRKTVPASDIEMMNYWRSVVIGRDMPEDEKDLSMTEIGMLETAIKTDVEKNEIKKLIKGGANVAGVVILERQKVLHIKELKLLEKAQKAGKKLLEEKENEDE
jgi:hypothetical protein